jgi:hypothetical protein
VREKVEEGIINTQRVDTKDNLADIFTKALPRPTHEDLVSRLNLQSGGATTLGSSSSSKEGEEKTDPDTRILSGAAAPSDPWHRGRVGSQIT